MTSLLVLMAIIVVLVVFAAIALAVLRAKSGSGSTSGPWPFSLRKPLTEPEQILYFRLCKALPDHMVLAQVGMTRFLGVRRGHDTRAWNNRINRMSIDFLICNKDASVVAAIELDDPSHQRLDRVTTDEKKDKALRAAGVRLLRWDVGTMPDESAIRLAITCESKAPARQGPADSHTRPASLRPA
jgi:hypothetical protein